MALLWLFHRFVLNTNLFFFYQNLFQLTQSKFDDPGNSFSLSSINMKIPHHLWNLIQHFTLFARKIVNIICKIIGRVLMSILSLRNSQPYEKSMNMGTWMEGHKCGQNRHDVRGMTRARKLRMTWPLQMAPFFTRDNVLDDLIYDGNKSRWVTQTNIIPSFKVNAVHGKFSP